MAERDNPDRGAALCSACGEPAPDQLVRALEARGRQIVARKDQTILSSGARSSDVYIVLSGRVRAKLFSVAGREVVMRDLLPGQMFGELSAFDGSRRSVSIVALEASRMLLVPAQAFRQAGADDPESALWLHRHLTAMIRSLTDRVFELSAINVQGRIHCQLLRMVAAAGAADNRAVIAPVPTHEAMAALTGTHREAVSREMSALARAGLVQQQGRRLLVKDVMRLSLLVQDATGADTTEADDPAPRPE